MKRQKRIYLGLFLIALTILFVGCAQEEGKVSPTPSPTPTPEVTETPVAKETPNVEEIVGKAIESMFIKALSLHYDNPNTDEIEGVNVNPEFGCQGCHFSKEAAVRMEQWGKSAHGGYLLELKEKDLSAAVTEEKAPAWVHYDFKSGNRLPCQKCHTSTGFRNFITDPENYNPENNTFLYTGKQKEMLYCWACHKVEDGSFQLRDPGKFEKVAEYSVPENRISAVPDLGKANLCMVCHSGRSSGEVIKKTEEIRGKHFGAFNSHYLAAGGIIFRTIAYEFGDMEYTSFNPHASIENLCVACHMSNDDHTFEAVEKKNGEVKDVKAYEDVCSKCHADKQALIDEINQNRKGFEASLKVIEDLLAQKGIYYNLHAYPYFYPSPNPEEQIFPKAYKDWSDKDVLGAAFNLNLLYHEPGAFVHNPEYTKQIIYDTIDFLDDGELNKSVESTVTGDALKYISGAR